ncbi:MAG: hypothetical protein OXG26_01625 [Caldilineaceae bacterium]|uniref:Uncharacterized protein n=1 Tax=Caldilineaceae bacterium SB0661_bin_32 TaxID=2605255 RepID=A0A6B1DBE1_9CHLR|nr:hypothetical protein [Caldilineaceae bacterium]MDE0634191.1 hypothetical protein [Caldilineaceae bacterium]MYC96899.1 hypothetical protein [Caldilineaceae bacterium SB0661_bin_32]
MDQREEATYEDAVLQELRGIRETASQASGKLDMLAVIDKKLGKGVRRNGFWQGLTAFWQSMTMTNRTILVIAIASVLMHAAGLEGREIIEGLMPGR